MFVDNIPQLLIFIFSLVPGFVLISVRGRFIPLDRKPINEMILDYMIATAWCYGLNSWLIIIAYNLQDDMRLIEVALAVFWFAILSPAIFGIASVWITQHNIFKSIFTRMGLKYISDISSAWDYQFHRVDSMKWVIITLTDGKTITGIFGEKSFASSQGDYGDVYLESVYIIDEQGNWKQDDQTDGIIVKGSEIRFVEFWSNKE
jgi:hypothetical protein